ncbi:nuclear fusion defective 6 [Striga asiatica]|uniref:Nuclear fusion defective 6 n=1 Tax=Striga asiatica TaxID=4170 RepID=A0A5A7PLW1_STRAF|nr:nuclear fusion defective 6 [Striga asiatica]
MHSQSVNACMRSTPVIRCNIKPDSVDKIGVCYLHFKSLDVALLEIIGEFGQRKHLCTLNFQIRQLLPLHPSRYSAELGSTGSIIGHTLFIVQQKCAIVLNGKAR